MWQAWLTLPSCLASSKRPTLARMIFCSLVMTMFLVNAEAGRCAPRPLRARPRLMPQPNDTVCQIKSKLLHFIIRDAEQRLALLRGQKLPALHTSPPAGHNHRSPGACVKGAGSFELVQ